MKTRRHSTQALASHGRKLPPKVVRSGSDGGSEGGTEADIGADNSALADTEVVAVVVTATAARVEWRTGK